MPIPYPNISQSITLAKGTTTVKADGGMMIANKGSEFSLSNGDNAGVAGGVEIIHLHEGEHVDPLLF